MEAGQFRVDLEDGGVQVRHDVGFLFLVTWTTMKMMTSRATTQRVSTSMRMCTSMLLSTVVAAVGSGESEMGRSEDLCLHMGT